MASLEITVLRCSDLPKVQRLGVQDPFIIIKYAGHTRRTPVHKNGGQNPVFNARVLFTYVPGETVVKFQILNDRGREGEFIASTRLDFGAALETGFLETRLPVADARGRTHGDLELAIRCPRIRVQVAPPPETSAAEAVAALELAEAKKTYEQGLSEARAKYYGEVATAMVPHNAVAGAMAESFVMSVKEVKDQDVSEMESIFSSAKEKVKELVDDAIKEWTQLGADFRKDVADKIVEHDPESKERMAKQLESLSKNMLENGSRAKGEFEVANAELLAGMDALLAKYGAALGAAVEGYELGFKKVLGTYKDEVEEMLKEEAEKKSREDAAKLGSPPPQAPEETIATVVVISQAPAPLSSFPVAPTAYPYTPPAPQPTVPPVSAAAGVAVGVAAGAAVGALTVEKAVAEKNAAEAEKARAEAALAQQRAYYEQQQMYQAQMQAEAQRQAAAKREAAMQAEIMMHRRRRAVRRGVVGGVILAKMIG